MRALADQTGGAWRVPPRETRGGEAHLPARGGNMDSKAKLAGHAIHPMLIVFPLGLLATSFFFDLIHLASGGERWGYASFYMIAAGILGALVSAVFGLVDWLAIPPGP